MRLAACAVGEVFMVDEAFAPFTVRETIAPAAWGEATVPLPVREAIAACTLGGAHTSEWTI